MSTTPTARIRFPRPVRTTLTALGLTTVLVVGIDCAGYAATGHSLLLGKANRANKQTTITRTTSGPVLSLKGGSSADAPLAVTGTGLVTNLNADKLDGLDASAFARAGSAQEKAYLVEKTITVPTSDVTFSLPVPDGTYEVSYSAAVAGSPAGTTLECGVTLGSGNIAVKRIGEVATRTTGGGSDGVSGTGVVTKNGGRSLTLDCWEVGGSFTTAGITPIQVVLRPLDVVTPVTPG